jgi:hypothetical protein
MKDKNIDFKKIQNYLNELANYIVYEEKDINYKEILYSKFPSEFDYIEYAILSMKKRIEDLEKNSNNE